MHAIQTNQQLEIKGSSMHVIQTNQQLKIRGSSMHVASKSATCVKSPDLIDIFF